MMGMLVLRFATVLAIAVWIGGLLALGAIAAPAIFDVVSLRQVPDGRMLSGAIFGEALRRFHLVSYGCGAVIVVALFVRARARAASTPVLDPPRHRRADARRDAVLGAGRCRGRSSACSRRSAPASPRRASPTTDPRRVAFGRLHAQSIFIQLVPLIGGLVLMLFELRD